MGRIDLGILAKSGPLDLSFLIVFYPPLSCHAENCHQDQINNYRKQVQDHTSRDSNETKHFVNLLMVSIFPFSLVSTIKHKSSDEGTILQTERGGGIFD